MEKALFKDERNGFSTDNRQGRGAVENALTRSTGQVENARIAVVEEWRHAIVPCPGTDLSCADADSMVGPFLTV